MTKRETGPSRQPQTVQPEVWYYEEPTKIRVYVSPEMWRVCGNQVISFTIPKRKLKASLRRMDEKP